MTWLIKQGVPFIFYPALFYERNETPDANNHYNCPIVTSYSENIKNNVEEIGRGEVKFSNPFLAFSSLEVATEALIKEFSDIPAAEVTAAARAGWDEMTAARDDMRKKGEEVLAWMEANHKRGIVLAGRPYHVDPEINHGIPELITFLRAGCPYGGFRFSPRSPGPSADRFRPVDVSLPPVCAAAYVRTRDRSGV